MKQKLKVLDLMQFTVINVIKSKKLNKQIRVNIGVCQLS